MWAEEEEYDDDDDGDEEEEEEEYDKMPPAPLHSTRFAWHLGSPPDDDDDMTIMMMMMMIRIVTMMMVMMIMMIKMFCFCIPREAGRAESNASGQAAMPGNSRQCRQEKKHCRKKQFRLQWKNIKLYKCTAS